MMNMRTVASFALIGLAVAGCSARQEPPVTPTMQAATPTNRGTVNSWELTIGKIHTEPGLASARIPLIPDSVVQQGYEPSDPLAVAVYNELVHQKLETQFVVAAAKQGTVMLEGVVGDDAQKTRIGQAAKGVAGVKKVVNDLKVSAQPPTT